MRYEIRIASITPVGDRREIVELREDVAMGVLLGNVLERFCDADSGDALGILARAICTLDEKRPRDRDANDFANRARDYLDHLAVKKIAQATDGAKVVPGGKSS